MISELFELFRGNGSVMTIIVDILAILVIIFLILPFHEWAHAFAASKLGDTGIKNRGRLTLNPLSHIDPIGALCMLLFGFGWAKPVPVDSRYFKNPKLGMAITALAGPLANIVAGLAGMIIFNVLRFLLPQFSLGTAVGNYVMLFLSFYVQVNINLAVFNLLPIPPLDGSKILFVILPDRAVAFCYRYKMFFFIALFALVSYGPLRWVLSFLSTGLYNGMYWLTSLPFLAFQ